MSEEEFLRNQREIFYDRKYDAGLQAVAESAAAEAAGMGGMPPAGGEPGGLGGGDEGGLGADPGGAAPLGGETEMPPDAAADPGAEPAPEPETGDLLAAPPGSRPSPRMHQGPRSHSPKRYDPVKVDGRDMGARKRSYNSIGRPEFGTYRTTNLGASELRSLSKGVFTEERSNYTDPDVLEESRLFEINHEVRTLINNLERNSEHSKDENEA